MKNIHWTHYDIEQICLSLYKNGLFQSTSDIDLSDVLIVDGNKMRNYKRPSSKIKILKNDYFICVGELEKLPVIGDRYIFLHIKSGKFVIMHEYDFLPVLKK